MTKPQRLLKYVIMVVDNITKRRGVVRRWYVYNNKILYYTYLTKDKKKKNDRK